MQKNILNRIISRIFQKENRLFLYLSFVIIFLLFLSAYASKWSSNQTIESFSVVGNKYIPTNELLGNVDSSLIECNRNDIDLQKLKKEILSHPYVFSSYVMQKNSSAIEIEVKERKPIAILVKNDGNLCYCDESGTVLPYRLSMQFQELPVLRNLFNRDKIDTNGLSNVLNILVELNKKEFVEFARIISEIEYDKYNKSFAITTNDNSYSVIFGRAENIKTKLKLLSEFYNSSIRNINPADIRYIDARWDDRIIVKTGFDEIIPVVADSTAKPVT